MSDTSREIYRGRVVHLHVDQITLPNGHRTEIEVVRHPGATAIVPLHDDDSVTLIRQYRHATGGYIFEVPAGKLDPGEAPDVCARRELQEETGLVTSDLVTLGSTWTTPGFSDEVIHLYLARALTEGAQSLEETEVLTLHRVPFAEAIDRCVRGDIRDAKSVCALLLAQQHLSRAR